MPDYKIFETNEFIKKLKKLSPRDRSFIEKKLRVYTYRQFTNEPHFGPNIKKLRDYTPDQWRYRLPGKFRLFYSIDEHDKIIFILSIDFRKDAY